MIRGGIGPAVANEAMTCSASSGSAWRSPNRWLQSGLVREPWQRSGFRKNNGVLAIPAGPIAVVGAVDRESRTCEPVDSTR